MKKIAILLFSLCIGAEAYAQETRYIRDQLWVPLRSGQTSQHRIVHKGLVSGTAMKVLSQSDDKLYTQVRTSSGIEGWVQTQYLSATPAGRDQYKKAQKTIAQLQTEQAQLKKKLGTLQANFQQAQGKVGQLSHSGNQQQQELDEIRAISAKSIQLNSDNQTLLLENQQLKNKVDVVSAENQQLNDSLDNNDFLNGAFAVLIGVFITLIVPRAWPKKKSSEWG